MIDLRSRVSQRSGGEDARGSVPQRTSRRTSTPRAHAQRGAAPLAVSPAVRKRRQDILVGLGAAAVLTLLCTVAFGEKFLLVHVAADLLLLGYVLLLHQTTNATQSAPAPARRSARSGQPAVRTVDVQSSSVARVSPAAVRSIAN